MQWKDVYQGGGGRVNQQFELGFFLLIWIGWEIYKKVLIAGSTAVVSQEKWGSYLLVLYTFSDK
jgi:hypothetical protein